MNSKWKKISTLIGSMLINCFSKGTCYWGNMAVYVMPYILHGTESGRLVSPNWYFVTYNLGWMIGVFVVDVLERHVKPKYLILTGIVILNSSLLGSAFSDGLPWVGYVFIFSTVYGCGLGMFELLVLKIYVLEATDAKEVVTAVYITIASAGSSLVNQFMTWWVNPDNLVPDRQLDNMVLFSQKEIIDRVPSMFLVLGGTTTVFQLVGFCLLWDLRPCDGKDTGLMSRDGPTYNSLDLETLEVNGTAEDMPSETNNERIPGRNIANPDSLEDEPGQSFIQLLCSRNLQRLIFVYFGLIQIFDLIGASFKVYGSLWIEDDYFFSDLSTVMGLPTLISNIVAGMCLGRFGLRLCFMALSSSSAFLCLFMYFSAMMSPSLYFVVTVIVYSLSNGCYCYVSVAAVILFGKKYIIRFCAVLGVANVVGSLTVSIVAEMLTRSYGWFWAFAWCSLMAIFVLVLATFGFSKPRSKGVEKSTTRQE